MIMNIKITQYITGLLLILLTSTSYAIKGPVPNTLVKEFSYRLLWSVYDFNHKNITTRQKASA
jgi:hypothetical protein